VDGELDASVLAGLLADPIRMKVVGAVALGHRTPAAVADVTGVRLRDAGQALARLVSTGVLMGGPKEYDVDWDHLRDVARAAAATRPDPAAGVDPDDARSGVLRRFFRNGRLTAIPVPRSKRLVVLDFLAGHFEPGQTYPEVEVNRILGQFHEDTAALRRYMVDEMFFERRGGFYWRAGGTFDIDPTE